MWPKVDYLDNANILAQQQEAVKVAHHDHDVLAAAGVRPDSRHALGLRPTSHFYTCGSYADITSHCSDTA
ncbi:hypothetical protein BDN67DRAFT_975119 [Paxillus ammoniavirescens]|nr:hypothetical protein BDN67DRAFT_975119 [Paxillus ammoniavirescens]